MKTTRSTIKQRTAVAIGMAKTLDEVAELARKWAAHAEDLRTRTVGDRQSLNRDARSYELAAERAAKKAGQMAAEARPAVEDSPNTSATPERNCELQ